MEIDKKVIADKIKLIEKYVARLQNLRKSSGGNFTLPDNFDIAAYNLRSALEAAFDICGHILARIPGAQVDEYKKMAIEMGKQAVVPLEFAAGTLAKMAGYRNRLTHFYFEISPQEMGDIIRHNLGDFDTFLKHVKKCLGA